MKSKTTGRKLYDPDAKNQDRADYAMQALLRFQEVTGTDDDDAIADLLCDLQHLCDYETRFGKFADCLDLATRARPRAGQRTTGPEGMTHYEAETSKEG